MSGLREQIEKAIWDELQRQHHGDDAFTPYVDPSDHCIDGHVDMSAAADAVIDALGLTEETQELRSFGRTEPLKARRRWVSSWSTVGGEQ